MSKYHRNAIITGYIDSYCLVCESHLRSEDDINGHLAKPIHSKNLESMGFLEKYKDDCVRKVKKGYYCEFCNILLTTAAKVGLHIVEEKHVTNKGILLLKRIGNNITFHNSILINDKAWNGLIEETCAICNTEFDNESLHKTETTHILNLVQNKVAFGPDNSIYRKIDDGSFQCLTCNMVLGSNTLATHFEESEHTKLYQECARAFINLNINVKSETDTDNIQVQKENPSSQPVQEKPPSVAKEVKRTAQVTTENKKAAQVTIENKNTANFTSENKKPAQLSTESEKDAQVTTEIKKATPPLAEKPEVKKDEPVTTIKKPDTSTKKQSPPPVEVTKPEAEEAKKSSKPKLEKVTQELDDEICKVLDAKDYITHDENGKKWCLLCDWTMENIAIHSHVRGRHHQTMLKMHKERIRKKAQKCTKEISKAEETKKEKEDSPADENKSRILDCVLQYQNNDININFVCNIAVCKKCLKYLDFNCHSIEAHIEEHKKAPPKKETLKPAPTQTVNQKQKDSEKTQAANTQKDKKTQSQKLHNDERPSSRASSIASNKENDEEVEKFAKANDLAYSRGDNKVYCRVCDSRVPSSLKNMKEHIAGLHHKNKTVKWHELKQNPKNPVTIKKSMKDFIKNLVSVEHGYVKDVVINERYCINIFSFMMITQLERLRCEPCDLDLNVGELDHHKNSAKHQRALYETPIIVSIESEFIREVRPDIFHCGYCNIVEGGSEIEEHLSSCSHREARTASAWRLQQALPDLMLQHSRKQPVEILMLMKMLACDLFC